MTDNIIKQAQNGLDDSVFLWLEDIAKTSEKLMFRTRNTLDSPLFNFSSLIGKWVYAASLILKLLSQVGIISLIGAAIVAVTQFFNNQALYLVEIFNLMVANRIYQAIIIILIITNIRHILFRLGDQEV